MQKRKEKNPEKKEKTLRKIGKAVAAAAAFYHTYILYRRCFRATTYNIKYRQSFNVYMNDISSFSHLPQFLP